MRFMILIKADQDSENGTMPDETLLTRMGNFNDELVEAGLLLAGEGLHPSKKGVRLKIAGEQTRVIDGPFAETKELIAGFWIWKCKDREEAIAWAKRFPHVKGSEPELEIRQIFEMEDFGAELTPELRAQEDRQRAAIDKKS